MAKECHVVSRTLRYKLYMYTVASQLKTKAKAWGAPMSSISIFQMP